jgi:hypothetical protein
VQLTREPRRRLLVLLGAELEAVRPVDREGIDAEALQRLEQGVACAAEERDALRDLGRLRGMLEEEDVGERMARAEDGDVRLVGEGEELRLKLVDLADRLPKVALVDLVGGHGSSHGGSLNFCSRGPSP